MHLVLVTTGNEACERKARAIIFSCNVIAVAGKLTSTGAPWLISKKMKIEIQISVGGRKSTFSQLERSPYFFGAVQNTTLHSLPALIVRMPFFRITYVLVRVIRCVRRASMHNFVRSFVRPSHSSRCTCIREQKHEESTLLVVQVPLCFVELNQRAQGFASTLSLLLILPLFSRIMRCW